MATRDILIYGDPILRAKANAVETIDDSTRELVQDMIETMKEAEGIGLAAPQVGVQMSVCVVNLDFIDEGSPAKAFVNPVIMGSEGSSEVEEGCLSIPDIRENVTRPEKIVVRYKDLDGNEHEEACDSMLARVLQHEIDHLNGILFIDHLSPIKRSLLAKKLKALAAGK
jgi:peptide deformylase